MAHRGQISFLSIRRTLIYSRADQPASPPPKANTHRKHGCLCVVAGRGVAHVLHLASPFTPGRVGFYPETHFKTEFLQLGRYCLGAVWKMQRYAS